MALEKFVNAYVARTPRSREIYEDARNYLPGGVSGNAKFLKPYPLYVKRARGSHVIDVDGNDYVDLLDAVGAAILGHGHESIRSAVKAQIDEAILPLMATELEVKLAKKVSHLMDYMEMIRFVNTGSEATHDGDAGGARVHRARAGREVRGQLPWPARLVADRWRGGGAGAPRANRSRRPIARASRARWSITS